MSMEREGQIRLARQLLESGVLSEESANAIKADFPELAESEDERIRKLLVWQVHRNIEDETNDLAQSVYDGIKGHDPDIEESIEDWKKCLAYLEKQKEQKGSLRVIKDASEWEKIKEQQPAEWSEEDRDRVAQYLRDRNKKMLWPEAEKITNDILDRLRPQPHWEPSEEQMDTLQIAYKDMRNIKMRSTLLSLYNDLKKLM